jgi:hypothetical protein
LFAVRELAGSPAITLIAKKPQKFIDKRYELLPVNNDQAVRLMLAGVLEKSSYNGVRTYKTRA